MKIQFSAQIHKLELSNLSWPAKFGPSCVKGAVISVRGRIILSSIIPIAGRYGNWSNGKIRQNSFMPFPVFLSSYKFRQNYSNKIRSAPKSVQIRILTQQYCIIAAWGASPRLATSCSGKNEVQLL